jgi:hypothetical protein
VFLGPAPPPFQARYHFLLAPSHRLLHWCKPCPLHRCFQTALNHHLIARRLSPEGYAAVGAGLC